MELMTTTTKPRCHICGATAGTFHERDTTTEERTAEPGCPRTVWECLSHSPKVSRRRSFR